MSSAPGTLGAVAIELSKLFRPLQGDLATADQARAFFAKMGFTLTNAQVAGMDPAPRSTAASHTGDLITIVEALVQASATGNDTAIAVQTGEAIPKIASIVNSLSTLGSQLSGLVSVSASEVARRIFHDLIFDYLEAARGLNDVLELLGLLEREDHDEDSLDPDHPPFTIVTYRFDRIGGWFSDPFGQLQTMYGWGNGFDGNALFAKIERIVARNGLPVVYDPAAPKLDLVLIEAVPKTDVPHHGLLIRLKSNISKGVQTIEAGPDVKLEIKADFQPPFNTGVTILPSGTVKLQPPVPGPSFGGDFLLKLIARRTAPPEPFILFGAAGGSRLELGEFIFTTGARVAWSGGSASGSFLFGADANELKVVIDTTDKDGFLAKILPGKKVEAGFNLQMGISTDRGFYFSGSSALEVRLPAHIEIGPVSIEALTIAARLEEGKIPVSVGADIRASLGPMVAVVQNMGVTATFSFPPGNGGNLGPLQFDLGFKPPNGVGLSIDTGAIKGGGFLNLDFDEGRVLRRARAVVPELHHAEGGRHHQHEAAGRQQGLRPADPGDGGVHAHPARLRLHADRRGRPAGAEPHARHRGADDGRAHGRGRTASCSRQDVVANISRIISDLKTIFPIAAGAFHHRADGQAGLGNADPDLARDRSDPRHPAAAVHDPRRAALPAAVGGRAAAEAAGELRRRHRFRPAG